MWGMWYVSVRERGTCVCEGRGCAQGMCVCDRGVCVCARGGVYMRCVRV